MIVAWVSVIARMAIISLHVNVKTVLQSDYLLLIQILSKISKGVVGQEGFVVGALPPSAMALSEQI